MVDVKNSFSSKEAAELFESCTGFAFHTSVPGTLLARCGIEKLPISGRPSRFDASNWRMLWNAMLELAADRCYYNKALAAPRLCPMPSIVKKIERPMNAPFTGGNRPVEPAIRLGEHPNQFRPIATQQRAKKRWIAKPMPELRSLRKLDRDSDLRLAHLINKDD